MPRRGQRALQTFLLLGIERPVDIIEQERAVTDHSIDRRAQLVTHRCVEPVACTHRLFQRHLPPVKLVVHL